MTYGDRRQQFVNTSSISTYLFKYEIIKAAFILVFFPFPYLESTHATRKYHEICMLVINRS